MPEDTPKPKLLTREVASPTVGVRQAIDSRRVLPGMDMSRLARVLRNAERGDVRDLLTLAEEIERRDLHYSSVLNTRKLAVWGLPPRVDAATESARDVEIADFIRNDVTSQPWFRNMLRDNLDALAKGYSVVELLWDTSGGQWLPKQANYVDPRFFTWLRNTPTDPTHGRELYLRTDKNATGGEPLEGLGRGKWILHQARLRSGAPYRDGLMWPVCVYFAFKNFSVRDWLAYAEVFGMPVRVGKYDPGATEKDIETLKTAVRDIGSDAGAVVPDTMMLEFLGVAGGQGGDKLFKDLAEWIDKQVSKGVLGQTMTSEDGSSLAQAEVHNDVRKDLLAADAENLSATLQQQLIVPIVDYNFGPQEKYPELVIAIEDQEDLDSLATSLTPFIDRGMRVSEGEVRDKFGLQEPDEDEPILGNAAPTTPVEAKEQAEAGRQAAVEAAQQPSDDGDPDPGEDDDDSPAETNFRRSRLARVMGLNAENGPKLDDAVEEFASGADDGWQEIMDPVLVAMRAAHAEANGDAELFKSLLSAKLAELPHNKFQDQLATLDLVARGIGDASDSL